MATTIAFNFLYRIEIISLSIICFYQVIITMSFKKKIHQLKKDTPLNWNKNIEIYNHIYKTKYMYL